MECVELIGKYLAGESSPQENEALLGWVGKHPDNKVLFMELCQVWHSSGKGTVMFDENTKYNEFLAKIRNIKQQPTVAKTVALKHSTLRRIAKIALPLAASIVMALGIVYLFKSFDKSTTYANNSSSVLTQKLSDGTVVYLNKNSKLVAPHVFKGDKRSVAMNGEAFFEVTKSTVPFEVQLGTTSVTVLGTSFNINIDSVNQSCKVTVTTGKVRLSVNNTDRYVELTPGEVGQFNAIEDILSEVNNSDLNYLSWKTGVLSFRSTNLKTVIHDVERQYGVKFEISNEVEEDLALTATFDNQSVESVCKMIELSCNVKISKQNTIFVVRK